jgi:hypothetical protein
VLRDYVEGCVVGCGVWRRRRPDLQAVMLRSCKELKMKIWNWDVDVGRWMINCSIPLILIGIQTIGGIMDEIPTTSTSTGRFLGAISLQQTMERKQAKKTLKTNLNSEFSVSLLGEHVGFLMPSICTDNAPKFSARTATQAEKRYRSTFTVWVQQELSSHQTLRLRLF